MPKGMRKDISDAIYAEEDKAKYRGAFVKKMKEQDRKERSRVATAKFQKEKKTQRNNDGTLTTKGSGTY